MASIEERVEALVKKPIENLGYQLYDVQYAKEGKDYFLRIFIENQNGQISLEDCEKVNNEIEELLDTADYIKEQYFLEVSSTGVEKIIRKEKHLQENIDEYISINLFKPINNSKEFIGILKKFDDETIYIEVNGEIIELERKNISLIKKYYDWDNEI
ncbi:MAG: ribosome maturation factor RimP [Clostridia bacterium]|nr:ribosome maturation factor RimP [Clostridia bacterium]